ncbi:hypothetical protein CR513_56506, partial [Mucuna pruriens]
MEEWMKFQQNLNATMHDLKMQIGQLANSVSQIQSTGSGNLPSQTIPNPKGGNMSVVTLRSSKELQNAPQPTPNPTETKSKPDVDSRVQQQARSTPLPFPSRELLAKKPKTDEDLLKMFRRVEINIPLLDAIEQVPKYSKFLKELCVHKRKKLIARTKVGVSFTIGGCTFADAMLDLGASINVMPASVYKSLNFGDLEPTGIVIQLANRSVVRPVGVLKDVLVQVNELIFPADFYVLDMEDETSEKGSTLILG